MPPTPLFAAVLFPPCTMLRANRRLEGRVRSHSPLHDGVITSTERLEGTLLSELKAGRVEIDSRGNAVDVVPIDVVPSFV